MPVDGLPLAGDCLLGRENLPVKRRYDPGHHHRHSIRLPSHDYRSSAVYFVTICTHGRENLFDDPRFRRIAESLWQAIPSHPQAHRVTLDEWIVMPNHLHGLLVFGPAEAGSPSEPPLRPDGWIGLAAGSLGAIVGNYKSLVTRRINELRDTPGAPVWQRNYYERIVRNQRQLDALRQYIAENPARWAADRDNLDGFLSGMTNRR
jgi:putative transposase